MTDKTCTACFKDLDARALRCPHCTQRQGDVVGLYRDLPSRAVGGVTAAIAHHFSWDVTLVRVAFVLSFTVLGPTPLWAYLAIWLMTPFAQTGKAPLTRLTEWLGNLFSPANGGGVEKVEQPVE